MKFRLETLDLALASRFVILLKHKLTIGKGYVIQLKVYVTLSVRFMTEIFGLSSKFPSIYFDLSTLA
jgi:hypothetical protein